MQTISFGDLEIVVVLGHGTLLLDVLRNDLIGHITAGGHEESSRPKVPAPERLAQSPEVREQVMRCLSFDGLHHSARRKCRGHAQQKVDVIGANVPLQNLNVVRAADLANQVAETKTNVTSKDRLAVLRDK